MKKFTHSMLAFMAATLLASALIGCGQSSADKDKELNELRQLAEMDRKEMENQYAEFAAQYGEMKKDIKDDSLVMRLDAERTRAEKAAVNKRNSQLTEQVAVAAQDRKSVV